jgi:hypothetical protein
LHFCGLNISGRGIAIKGHRIFPPGSTIVLNVYCYDGVGHEECAVKEVVRLEGKVAWVSPVGSGILPEMGIKLKHGITAIRPFSIKN